MALKDIASTQKRDLIAGQAGRLEEGDQHRPVLRVAMFVVSFDPTRACDGRPCALGELDLVHEAPIEEDHAQGCRHHLKRRGTCAFITSGLQKCSGQFPSALIDHRELVEARGVPVPLDEGDGMLLVSHTRLIGVDRAGAQGPGLGSCHLRRFFGCAAALLQGHQAVQAIEHLFNDACTMCTQVVDLLLCHRGGMHC